MSRRYKYAIDANENLWIFKHFLTKQEKHALIKYYQERMGIYGDELTTEEEWASKTCSGRISFIIKYF